MKRSLLLGFHLEGNRALQLGEFEILDRLSAGVILLDRSGKISFANSTARSLSRDDGPFRFRHSAVATASTSHVAQLQKLIQRALRGVPVSSMSVPHPYDGRLLTVLVTAMRSRYFDQFSDLHLKDVAAFLLIIDPVKGAIVPLDWIMDAYALTTAEARVAVVASAGVTIFETSRQLGLSPNTVKTHLRKVFAKTGTNRQTELVRLMTSIGVLRADLPGSTESN